MGGGGGLSLRGFVATQLLLVLLVACSCCGATRNWLPHESSTSNKRHGKHSPPPSPKTKPPPMPSPSDHPPVAPEGSGSTFSVLDYGAKGDGSTDDTKAFKAAWSAACEAASASSKFVVPSNSEFLVGPISFSGPCKSTIVFQWLEFRLLEGFTIQGQGTIEGKGSVWWSSQSLLSSNPIGTVLSGLPHTKPTAVRFYGSSDVTVTGITIQNSPQFHLKFDNCRAVEVSGVGISSPGDSPNTDGIHLQNSVDVSIHDTDLSCGSDDCISIQTGCSNILIQNINCGPGHGISIGGLGKANGQASVSNVTVRNANMVGTMTGVRIKTWQGGSGYVKSIRFSKIKVSQVKTPIVINQFYCDQLGKCKNQTSAVALSDITYDGIAGTYTVQPVYLACSDSMPCQNIHLDDIQLQLDEQSTARAYDPFCWQVYGDLQGPTQPPIDCLLQTGKTN
ncbi:polygalacturonase [Canna indica]|uniref:Polygalacturonase n=1 Tax=Canna indica TaxID=4628 RepID=A0AAQ3QII5_9LILI|nr:polygalacturonase [Canna indica]